MLTERRIDYESLGKENQKSCFLSLRQFNLFASDGVVPVYARGAATRTRIRQHRGNSDGSEFFNMFNRVNFDETTATGNFAKLSSKGNFGALQQAGDPRIGQLALKLVSSVGVGNTTTIGVRSAGSALPLHGLERGRWIRPVASRCPEYLS